MLLSGAEFLGLGSAFMFPADAQPEGEVPHTRRLPPPSLSSLSGGRAPPEVPPNQANPQKPPAPPAQGAFHRRPPAKESGNVVNIHKANVCISAADELKMTFFGAILVLLYIGIPAEGPPKSNGGIPMKKFLSLLLTLAMLCAMLPAAYASTII